MIRARLSAAVAALLLLCTDAPAATASAASSDRLTVVELFQSQGCSSCPPADGNINAIAGRPDVLALSFAVTYWDQLGWKDTFGSPRWTARQWDYARRADRREVATPQVIVNGGATIVGSNSAQLVSVIARAGPARGGPALTIDGGLAKVAAAGRASPSTIWLVRYDPNTRNVPIRAGENGGRTLPHRDIVRELVSLGEWIGPAASFHLPAPTERGLASAILVQRGAGGPIIAARRI